MLLIAKEVAFLRQSRKQKIMCKRLFGLAFVILSTFSVVAQEKINVRFVNQYEEPVTNITVLNGADSAAYTTDSEGVVEIVLSAEEVVVLAEGYPVLKTTAQEIKKTKQVQLKRSFVWKDLLNPEFYILNGGLWLVLLIVFAETGLFAGFFLPGDGLLFVVGIYSSDLMREFYRSFNIEMVQNEWVDLFMLVGLISLMGILGNMLGYWFGRKIGPSMFNWKDRFLFKKQYLHDAHGFFEKHGGAAIVFARFLPAVRTFAPIVAGIVTMDRKKFMFYNIIGCLAWVISMIFAGHFLQIWVRKQFGFELREHLEIIVLVIVMLTTVPVFWKLFFAKRKTPDNTDPKSTS